MSAIGTAGLDLDDLRDTACEVTADSGTCRIRTPTPDDVPDLPTPRAPSGGGPGVPSTLLVVLLVVAILVVLAWLARSWLRTRGRSGDDDGDETDGVDEDVDGEVGARVVDHETPPARWRRLADEHRRDGRYRDSVRCEYRALVGELARSGHVDEIPGRTSGEEREQVAELAGHVSADFDVAADLFDRAWFDDAVVTAEDDARFVTASAAVTSTITSTSTSRVASS